MKRTLLFVLIALFTVMSVSVSVAFVEDSTTPNTAVTPTAEQSDEITGFVQDLCQLNKAAVKADTVGWLVGKFKEALGETAFTTSVTTGEFRNKSDNKNYCNIVARLSKTGATKQIIIGAHYDVTNGEGAADNATGVATLYYLMKSFARSKDIPCNITFVAFDGEEQGLLGSDYFVNGNEDVANDGMSAEEISNTLVMFNIDSIAVGKKLYLMCENKHTNLADVILANSDGIAEKPYARGTYGTYLDAVYGRGYGYYEYIQGSDHTPFRLKGIPVAFFFSGSYNSGSWDFDEGSVINSSSDTFDNLKNYSFVERVLTVNNAIVNTVLDEQFLDVANNARSQLVNLKLLYNAWWPSLVVLGVLVILAICTVLYSRKLQKKAILGTAEIKTQKVFEKPDASEIFSFAETKDDKKDIDDIFTFKK